MQNSKLSRSPLNRTYSNAVKLKKNLHNNSSMTSINNDLSRYDDLIKKARDTINKFQTDNMNKSRSKEKILNTSSGQNLEMKGSNSNYSIFGNIGNSSNDENNMDTSNNIRNENEVENYYKSLISQMKSDSNIQNERMKSLECQNKKNEMDLIDNERERIILEDKVKILQTRLNETKALYEDLRRQKENLENNYDQLRFDYKNDMKKAQMNSLNKNKEIEDILTKENEMIKSELNKFIKENINLKLSVKNLKQEMGSKANDIITNLKNENRRLSSQLESKKEKIQQLEEEKNEISNINLNNDDNIQDLKQQIISIKALVKDEKDKNKKLREEYNLIYEENSILKQEIIQLRENENKFTTQSDYLSSEGDIIDLHKYNELQKKYSNLLLENQGLKKIKEEFQNLINEHNKVQKLKSQKADKDKETIKKLRNEYDELFKENIFLKEYKTKYEQTLAEMELLKAKENEFDSVFKENERLRGMQDKLIKVSKENEDLIKINQASERDKTELKELKKKYLNLNENYTQIQNSFNDLMKVNDNLQDIQKKFNEVVKENKSLILLKEKYDESLKEIEKLNEIKNKYELLIEENNQLKEKFENRIKFDKFKSLSL